MKEQAPLLVVSARPEGPSVQVAEPVVECSLRHVAVMTRAVVLLLGLALPAGAQETSSEWYRKGVKRIQAAGYIHADYSPAREALQRSYRLRPTAESAYLLGWIAKKQRLRQEAAPWARRALELNPYSHNAAALYEELELKPVSVAERRALALSRRSRETWQASLERVRQPAVGSSRSGPEEAVKPADEVVLDRLTRPYAIGPAELPGEGAYRFFVTPEGGVGLEREERTVWRFSPPGSELAKIVVFPQQVLLLNSSRHYWLDRASGKLLATWPARLPSTLIRDEPSGPVTPDFMGAGPHYAQVYILGYHCFLRMSDGGGWGNYVSLHYHVLMSPEEDQVFGAYCPQGVEARHARTGKVQWTWSEFEERKGSASLLAVGRREVWVDLWNWGAVAALDRRTGRLLWRRDHRQGLPAGGPR